MKKKFLIVEIYKGVELYTTTCFAESEKSVVRTSLYKRCLVNKNFESIIDIKEVK